MEKLGWSLRRTQKTTRVRRETISIYLEAAGVGVWPSGGWSRQTGSKPAIEATTDFGVELRGPRSENPGRNPSASACEAFQVAIDLRLSRGRNAMAIWRDLVSDYGFTSSYQSVKRYLHKRRGSQLPQATGVILTAPGEEAQVDYGTGPIVRDPQSGKYRRTRWFVMTLGYSDHPINRIDELLPWNISSTPAEVSTKLIRGHLARRFTPVHPGRLRYLRKAASRYAY